MTPEAVEAVEVAEAASRWFVYENPRNTTPVAAVESGVTDRCSSLQRDTFRSLNELVRPLVRSGLGSPLPVGVGAVVLATMGRRSGTEREVPLVAARWGDRMVVSTVRSRSNWVRNLEADPRGAVWVNGGSRRVDASVRRLPGLSVAVLRSPARSAAS